MAQAPPLLINEEIRRQVLLEGVKENVWEGFLPYLKDIEKQVRARLSDEGETITAKARLNKLLTDVTAIQRSVYDDYTADLIDQLNDIAITESRLEAGAIDNVVVDFETVLPSNEQIIIAYQNTALSVEGNSLTLKPFLKDFSDQQIKLVNSAINQGFTQGQTVSQITRNIRGIRANNFQDGTLATVNRNDRAMVRTAVQNASSQAKQRVWDSNKNIVKGVEWVATLDSKTTPQCRALDGEIFPIDKGPRPPIHYGCRSTTTAVLDERFDFLDQGAKRPESGADGPGQTSTKTTYYDWLKRQPAIFQDEVLGVKRGKLLRNGGLTSQEFADLQLNRNFKPRTLAEMERIAPEAFKEANL